MIDPTPAIRAACTHLSAHDLQVWALALSGPMDRYGINTRNRIAAFVGQCAVETDGFAELIETADYRASRLCVVWPSRFPTLVSAIPYAHAPEKLLNTVYGGRMGNGPPASGDGWMFRGRGLIQTTGRDDYTRFAKAVGRTPEDAAAWMETPSGAADAACWDWTDMKCNPLADAWQITALSERINGGDTALSDRLLACNAALRGMGPTSGAPVEPPTAPQPPEPTADALNAAWIAANPGA